MIEVIHGFEGLDALGDDWNALADRFERPLLRHEWFSCCAHAFNQDGDLRVVVARRGGRMVAAAPLVLARGHGVGRLELLGGAVLHEPSGVLFADLDALVELVEGVASLGAPFLLNRVESGSPIRAVVGRRLGRRALVIDRNTSPSLAVEVRGDWTEYCGGLSSNLVQSLERKRRRAADLGRVTTEVLAPSVSEVEPVLDTVMDVEGSGWKGRRGSAMSSNARLGRFFRLYATSAAARGELRVSLLRFGAQVAAVEMGIETHRRWWQLKIGYQESLARFSPGALLAHDTLSYAFSRRLEAFEFLGSAEPWEERWNPVQRGYAAVMVYPASISGLLGACTDAGTRAARLIRAPFRRVQQHHR